MATSRRHQNKADWAKFREFSYLCSLQNRRNIHIFKLKEI